jgi:hypothetical protein
VARGIILYLALLLVPTLAPAQGTSHRIVFYNVENLFDTSDDPDTSDEEFTPTGSRHWTRERYHRKLRHLSSAILTAGGDSLPLLVGLAEVENRRVLIDLAHKTSLAAGNYGIIHADSPDPRGIDVALLYRPSLFRPLTTSFLPVHLSGTTPTRDILYCKGLLRNADTLHLFVCHFPSMLGGERSSEWKRLSAATVARHLIDSLHSATSHPAIILMGDLNGRRGRVQSMEARAGAQSVRAQVPLSEMFGYVMDLRSRSQGRATFTMQFDHYERVPAALAEEIMKRRR